MWNRLRHRNSPGRMHAALPAHGQPLERLEGRLMLSASWSSSASVLALPPKAATTAQSSAIQRLLHSSTRRPA